jgi:hypothetical protein
MVLVYEISELIWFIERNLRNFDVINFNIVVVDKIKLIRFKNNYKKTLYKNWV